MFGKNYGYKSGINKTMSNHLQNLAINISKRFNLKKNDYVLDIASNDGTLLNSYNENIKKVGIDPLVKKYIKNYKSIDYKISKFFDAGSIKKLKIPKFKIITALAVLYDLPDPNKFVNDIKKILDVNGILIIEVADLYLTLKNNVFDTFCHEHLEYYSYKSLNKLFSSNGLKIFDHEYLQTNGGSSRFYIAHKNSQIEIKKKINKVIKLENKFKIYKFSKLKHFYNSIKKLKYEFNRLIFGLKKSRKKIHGYGASTKGNILIQYYNLNNKQIDFIAEKNKQKYNCFTPGSKIQIISEKKSRNLRPDYYVVLPWHFEKEIIKREKKIRGKGTRFIFPLPKIKIV